MGEASGSQAVPEPIRVIGMPSGRGSMVMPGIASMPAMSCMAAVSACSGS